MPSYRFTAITPAGALVRGVTEAPSEAEAVEFIRRQGNIPMRTDAAGGAGSGAFEALWRFRALGRLEFSRSTLRRSEVAHFTRELAVMLGAGQDLDRALRFLDETAPNPRVRAVVRSLRDQVRDGATLHEALGRHPGSFPRLHIGLVRAAEAGGNLAATLERIATLMERERALAATLTSAMIYPAMLTAAAIGAIVLLLTEVLPQFTPLFEQNGASLPASTQFLVDAGAVISHYGLLILLLLSGLGALAWRLLREGAVRARFDALVLRIPVLGGVLSEVLASRFTRTLGTLLLNGVPLIAAMAIVRDVIGNRAGLAAIDRATEGAKSGAGLARTLGEAAIFPPRMIHLLRLGEETAQLGPMALRAAEIHEETTRIRVQRLVALLVPVITIVMGAAVAGIVSSLLLAMLSLNDLAQ